MRSDFHIRPNRSIIHRYVVESDVDLMSGVGQLKNTPCTPPAQPARLAPLIRLRNVVKAYSSAAGQFLALKGISLDIRRGEFLGVIGRSGAGKSTLVNMLSGIDHVSSGEVWVDDTPVHCLGESDLALWRGRNLGIVYQSFELLPTLSLVENITLPMDFTGTYRRGESERHAMDLLRLVGLEEHAHKPPSRISGGQVQRAAIARALANDPPLLVADEPTGNLDSATAEGIFELFARLVHQGKTILMVTHDRSLARYFTRTLVLADGELVS
jgi:putative ABC transport system ATP-binding protein